MQLLSLVSIPQPAQTHLHSVLRTARRQGGADGKESKKTRTCSWEVFLRRIATRWRGRRSTACRALNAFEHVHCDQTLITLVMCIFIID